VDYRVDLTYYDLAKNFRYHSFFEDDSLRYTVSEQLSPLFGPFSRWLKETWDEMQNS